ncbi:MAG: hypothetical protein ACSI46_23610 [Gloeotrichia echinulata DVL01]
MIIADINYLEVTTEDVVGGDGFSTAVTVGITKTVTQNVNESTSKTFTVNTAGLNGKLAEVSASADASGGKVLVAQIIAVTQTTANAANAVANVTAFTKNP